MENKIRQIVSEERIGGQFSRGTRVAFVVGSLAALGLFVWLLASGTPSDEWAKHADERGYTVNYPEEWQFTDSDEPGTWDVVENEERSVLVSMSATEIGGATTSTSPSAREMAEAIEEIYRNAGFQSLESFEIDSDNGEVATYAVAGSFTDGQGISWNFEEKGIVVAETGTIYIVRASATPDASNEHEETIDRMLESFHI